MVLVMKLASGHVAMLKITAANQKSQVAALQQLQMRAVHQNPRSVDDRLNGNTELLRAKKNDNPQLALLLVWLAARKAHLEDHFRFYLDNGFDVLWVRTNPKQLSFPATRRGSKKVARDVLDFLLAEKNRCYQNMMLHSFCIGGYQWAECLAKMRADPEKYDRVEKSKAQVHDPCVSVKSLSSAIPEALTRCPIYRSLSTVAAWGYMGLGYPFATRHYQDAKSHFLNKTVKVPEIHPNTTVDKVSCVKTGNEVVSGWQSLGVDIKPVTFADPKHVQHLGANADRYTEELVNLLKATIPNRTESGKWSHVIPAPKILPAIHEVL